MIIKLTQTAAIDGREMHPGDVVDIDPVFAMALIETGFAEVKKTSAKAEISDPQVPEVSTAKPKRKR
jgi:hypothetical protein